MLDSTTTTAVWKRCLAFIPLIVLAIALWLLFHEMSQFHWKEIENSIASIALSKILVAIALMVLNYLVLVGFDWIALRSIGVELGIGKIAFASFAGFVASYNFGATFGGVPVRYRIYSAFGLSAVQILQLSIMLAVTFWIGQFALAGMTFVFAPIAIPIESRLPFTSVYWLGWGLVALVVAYVVVVACFREPIRVLGKEVQLPSLPTTLMQLCVAATDILLASSILFFLLPNNIQTSFPQFLGVFLLATIAVVLTHVPGGIGVFELVILSMLADESNKEVVAALLVFRLIYYIVPLFGAALMVGGFEYRLRQEKLAPAVEQLRKAVAAVAPMLLSGVTLSAGAVLLISGATPSVQARVDSLRDWVPIPFIELSHFVGSLIGATLLIVARGLQRRLDSAWWMAIGLMTVGVFTSLLKGFDYEEALLVSLALALLLVNRNRFYRKGFLWHQRFSVSWIATIVVIVFSSLWLGIFAFKHVEYQQQLWWDFTLRGDASRFLRASVGVSVTLLCFSVWKLTRPTHTRDSGSEDVDWANVDAIVQSSSRTNSTLCYLRDKRFVIVPELNGFIMYGVEGRSWVSMGDPVAPVGNMPELVWRFREACDEYDGWPVFYQVDKENLSIYVEQGLTLLKIGEEARVRLADFSLEGQHKSLRSNRNKLLRAGWSFEIIDRSGTHANLAELRAISDSWLVEKMAKEKGFSLGFFSEDYLDRFPCAIVRNGGQMIAFANVLQTFSKVELSIDLMRYRSLGVNGVMDFLFTELMLWGKAEGYEWFNLGMAPLSGIENRPLSPLWNKAVTIAYKHGDQFYSFEGLRQYKEKFDPVWQPKYLASPGGYALPRILADLTRLIGRTRTSSNLSNQEPK